MLKDSCLEPNHISHYVKAVTIGESYNISNSQNQTQYPYRYYFPPSDSDHFSSFCPKLREYTYKPPLKLHWVKIRAKIKSTYIDIIAGLTYDQLEALKNTTYINQFIPGFTRNVLADEHGNVNLEFLPLENCLLHYDINATMLPIKGMECFVIIFNMKPSKKLGEWCNNLDIHSYIDINGLYNNTDDNMFHIITSDLEPWEDQIEERTVTVFHTLPRGTIYQHKLTKIVNTNVMLIELIGKEKRLKFIIPEDMFGLGLYVTISDEKDCPGSYLVKGELIRNYTGMLVDVERYYELFC